jgi:hypothetical protein
MVERRTDVDGTSITLLGGVAAWPVVAQAQQGDRVRRVGVLTGLSENEGKAALSAFARALAGLGWTVGRNVQVDVRFFGGNVDLMRTSAKELIGRLGACPLLPGQATESQPEEDRLAPLPRAAKPPRRR